MERLCVRMLLTWHHGRRSITKQWSTDPSRLKQQFPGQIQALLSDNNFATSNDHENLWAISVAARTVCLQCEMYVAGLYMCYDR